MKKGSATIASKILFFFLILIITVFMINGNALVFAEESSGAGTTATASETGASTSETGNSSTSETIGPETSETASTNEAATGTNTAEDITKQLIENYKFDGAAALLLSQPAICYITTIYFARVFDPATNQWSEMFTYGPFNGTGFVVNPEIGIIITCGDLVDDIETNYVALKNAILDEYILKTYPEDYGELTDTDWATIYDGFKVEGETTPNPGREVWVQFNTATASVPDNPGNNYIRAEVVKLSDSTQGNIAVLRITPSTGRALSSTLIGDSSKIDIATAVFVMGYPWTSNIGQNDPLSITLVKGSISGKSMVNGKSIYQISAYAVDGNSGSPVFDEDGSVIGMLTAGTDNLVNFLRPSSELKLMLDAENKLGPVDKEWKAGLALFKQNHFSEAIKRFNAVLNLSSGHLLAQEYKAKAQANMGSDVPITAETVPETAAEIAVQETVPVTTAPETTSAISSLLAFSLFGLNPLYTYLIFGGALLLFILLIVLIAVLFRRSKPKKTAPNVILANGPIYIASVNPPIALNQGDAGGSDTKMIETSGEQIEIDKQTKVSEDTDAKTAEEFDADKDIVKDSEATDAAAASKTGRQKVSKKDKNSKKPVSSDEKGTKEKPDDAKKTEPGQKKFCSNCGNPVLGTNIFCASCGNKLK